MSLTNVYRPIFINQELEDRLNNEGFVVFNLFSQEEIQKLRQQVEPFTKFHTELFSTSIWLEQRYIRQEVNNLLKPLMQEKLKHFLTPFMVIFTNLIVKKSSAMGELYIHRDWQLVDEQNYRALNVWCPLENVDEKNACLRFIPGSHKFRPYARGRNVFNPTQHITKNMKEKYSVHVPMQAGQCVLFDMRTYHGSGTNTSGQDRLAFSTVVTYRNTPIYHYVGDDQNDKLAKRLSVLPDFFVHYSYSKPDFKPGDDFVTGISDEVFEMHEITMEEFDSFMQNKPVANL